MLITDINPLGTATEHIHFQLDENGEFKHFYDFKLSETQKTLIWKCLFEDRALEVLNHIRDKRR